MASQRTARDQQTPPSRGDGGQRLKRRGALAGVAALMAGALAKWTAQPAMAGTDGDLILNTTNTASANTTLTGPPLPGGGFTLLTVTNQRIADAIVANGGPGSTGGVGRRGLVATGGDNTQSTSSGPSNGGDAIQATGGAATARGDGGDGLNATGGNGTNGLGGRGVTAQGGSPGGIGVRAFGGGTAGSQGAGVDSTTNSTNSAAVRASNAGTGPGVLAFANSATRAGVEGNNSGAGDGVFGNSTSGIGVHGSSTSVIGVYGNTSIGVGVFGDADNTRGVVGRANGGIGVFGQATTGTALQGQSTSGYGVYAQSTNNVGLFATSTNAIALQAVVSGGGQQAVRGESPNGTAIQGESANGIAIFGHSTSGQAGHFDGNVVVNGNFTVLPGFAKSGAVRFADGSVRRLYAMEAPESWFEDFGTGRLADGRASVTIDPGFAQAVNLSAEYHVFLTPHTEEVEALAVTLRAPDHFEVRANGKGQVNGTFSYRIVAKRKDLPAPRFEPVQGLELQPARAAADVVTPRPPVVPPLPEIPASARQIPPIVPPAEDSPKADRGGRR